MFSELRPAEDKKKMLSVHFELITQQVARLDPDFLTSNKIPCLVRIISDPFCIRCCGRPWMSLASVA